MSKNIATLKSYRSIKVIDVVPFDRLGRPMVPEELGEYNGE